MTDDLDPVPPSPEDPMGYAKANEAFGRAFAARYGTDLPPQTFELIDLPATPGETLAAELAIIAEDLARTLAKGEFAYGPDFDRRLLRELVELVVLLLPDLPPPPLPELAVGGKVGDLDLSIGEESVRIKATTTISSRVDGLADPDPEVRT